MFWKLIAFVNGTNEIGTFQNWPVWSTLVCVMRIDHFYFQYIATTQCSSYNTMLYSYLPFLTKLNWDAQRWRGTNYPVAMHTLIKYLSVCMHVLVKTVGCEWHTRGQGGTLAALYPGNTASISAGIQTAVLSLSHERLLAQHETHSLQSLTWRRIKIQHKGWLHAWVL